MAELRREREIKAELLAACEDMRERFRPMEPCQPNSPASKAIAILDAAIAKAKGGA